MHDHHTDGPFNDGDVTELPTGLSRRQTLQGMAWAAPAILVATAVPAASSSGSVVLIPAGQGVQVGELTPRHWDDFWIGPRRAILIGFYVQNIGYDVPAATTVTLTVQVPVSGDDHAWGIGGTEGIPSGQPWTLASYSRADGWATLVLVSTAGSWGPYKGESVSNLWLATADDLKTAKNQVVTVTANATYQGGATTALASAEKIKAKQ
ncbi:hypothetical protein [Demequina zhanjiangensis]|uniref:Tat (Twin-arginine translocation) pathway signal sequence n=1 Tax=Demequina zhanjiangensis TaxID=3051659 RepID=A0ABT8FYQ4_9MICO|nr:hypothetical protein [Demequina sp. SYSU T00b26]MDN4472010.1 hypothetical protein [Demequina sp. SYSU T00b26]